MKNHRIGLVCALTLLGVALCTPSVFAQSVEEKTESTTTTSTTTRTTSPSSGTVSQLGSDTIIIKPTPTSDPVTYQYTETTTYVDEAGNPVAMEMVKSGVPVTIHFTQTGETMTATKVVVKKSTVTHPRM
jgi:hypothetical protein